MTPEVAPVVIVAPPTDTHAQVVVSRLADRGYPCAVIDLADLPTKTICAQLDTRVSRPQPMLGLTAIDSSTVVWWRRARFPKPVSKVDPGVPSRFVANEWRHAIHGLLLASGCTIVNDPVAESAAQYKPAQLAVAASVGLHIPETCITSEASVAEEFITRLARRGLRCVFKPLTAPEAGMAETRTVAVSDILPESLSLAPVIFQEEIKKGSDVRVSIFGERAFGARVVTKHPELVDWRIDPAADYLPWQIPSALEGRLRRALRRLGLSTGSFDLRIDPAGREVFFEVNPSGQFAFLEESAGLPVTGAMADHLLRSRGSREGKPLPDRAAPPSGRTPIGTFAAAREACEIAVQGGEGE